MYFANSSGESEQEEASSSIRKYQRARDRFHAAYERRLESSLQDLAVEVIVRLVNPPYRVSAQSPRPYEDLHKKNAKSELSLSSAERLDSIAAWQRFLYGSSN